LSGTGTQTELERREIAGSKNDESSEQDRDPGQETKGIGGRAAHGLIFHDETTCKLTAIHFHKVQSGIAALIRVKTRDCVERFLQEGCSGDNLCPQLNISPRGESLNGDTTQRARQKCPNSRAIRNKSELLLRNQH
jgi:hypothetical protein